VSLPAKRRFLERLTDRGHRFRYNNPTNLRLI
jgi:hypothetical protein